MNYFVIIIELHINHWPAVIMAPHAHIGKYSMLTPHIQDVLCLTQSPVPTSRMAQWQVSTLLHGHWMNIDNSNIQP